MEKKRTVEIDYDILMDIFCKLQLNDALEKKVLPFTYEKCELIDIVENLLVNAKSKDLKNENI